MRNRLVGLVVAALALAAMPASAQLAAKNATPSGPVPHTADGRPDLSGVWEIPYTPDMSKQLGGQLPYLPWAEQNFKQYDPGNFDYTAHCLPAGWTRQMNTPMPIEIFQAPKRVAILFEAFSIYKVIPTDGREHRKDPEPSWMGDSVGKWEGDTLVIDTIGFNDKTRLDTIGHPHSTSLHVIDRLTRTDLGHLTYEVTIDDPKAYTKPWGNKRIFNLKPNWELMEYSCEENNKEVTEGHIK
jgi:hypothetical protein